MTISRCVTVCHGIFRQCSRFKYTIRFYLVSRFVTVCQATFRQFEANMALFPKKNKISDCRISTMHALFVIIRHDFKFCTHARFGAWILRESQQCKGCTQASAFLMPFWRKGWLGLSDFHGPLCRWGVPDGVAQWFGFGAVSSRTVG